MSPKEKKLLILFGAVGFIVLNFFIFKILKDKQAKVRADRIDAESKLELAEKFRESSDQIRDQMDWLAKHEPEPASSQDLQTKLQKLGESEARNSGLTIKSQTSLPTDTQGANYHQSNFKFVLSGTEQALYQWFDRVNLPEQFRVASHINMKPNQQDDTKIDCTVTISQWFVPAPVN